MLNGNYTAWGGYIWGTIFELEMEKRIPCLANGWIPRKCRRNGRQNI